MLRMDFYIPDLPANKFKKNDAVKFKYQKKVLTGKITKLGAKGVDVKSGNFFYYCYDWDHNSGIFLKSNQTKNYI